MFQTRTQEVVDVDIEQLSISSEICRNLVFSTTISKSSFCRSITIHHGFLSQDRGLRGFYDSHGAHGSSANISFMLTGLYYRSRSCASFFYSTWRPHQKALVSDQVVVSLPASPPNQRIKESFPNQLLALLVIKKKWVW
jgi:hypothetical protein